MIDDSSFIFAHKGYQVELFLITVNYISLQVHGNDRLTVRKLATITLKFTNPLDIPLTNCRVNLECSGTIWPTKEDVTDVPPKAGFYHTVTVRPRKSGSRTFVAVFSSEEMIDVCGSLKVDISENQWHLLSCANNQYITLYYISQNILHYIQYRFT